MAEIEYKTILEVETKDSVNTIGALRAQIKELRKDLDKAEAGSDDHKHALQELTTAQNVLKLAMKDSSKSLQELTNEAKGVGNSYNALTNKVRILNQEFYATTDTLKRAELSKQINDINTQLKEMDATRGVFSRNVGDYKNQIVNAFQAIGGSVGAAVPKVQGLNVAFKALIANPIGAVIAGLAAAIFAVVKALKSSEENIDAVRTALAPLNRVSTIFTNILQDMGKGIASAVTWLGKMADKLGLVSDKMKEEQDITKEDIAIKHKQREVDIANADAMLKVSQLRTKVAEKDKYTAKERIAFIEEAAKTEREIADRNVEMARREYELLQRKAALAGNSKEDNDELAQAYVNLQQAETSYFDKTRELAGQRVEAINMINAETKAIEKQTEAEWKQAQIRKEIDAELVEVDEKKLGKYDEDYFDGLQEMMDRETQMELDHAAEVARIEEQKKKTKVDVLFATARLTAGILGTIANTMQVHNKKDFERQKKMQIAEATINTIAGAVGAFMGITKDTGGWGIALAIATATSVMASGFAQIAKIKRTKYEGGGASAESGGMGAIGGASVSAPKTETQPLQNVRNITGAREEDRLNRPMRAYIVSSDLQADADSRRAQDNETSF